MESFKISGEDKTIGHGEDFAAKRKIKTKKGVLTHAEMLKEIRTSRPEREVLPNVLEGGYISFSSIPLAYHCPKCRFNAIFKADKCARCGEPIVG